jgi:hypothetical protein
MGGYRVTGQPVEAVERVTVENLLARPAADHPERVTGRAEYDVMSAVAG